MPMMTKAVLAFAMRIAAAAGVAVVTIPAMANDVLSAATRIEYARPPAPTIARAGFVQRATISSVAISSDGRRVAWFRERGRNREVWLQATIAGAAARRLMSHTTARRLAWSRDGRWLLLESPQHVFALAASGQNGSGIVAALGGHSKREFVGVDGTQAAAAIVLERLGMDTDGKPIAWRLARVDTRGHRTLLWQDTHRITGHALDMQGRLAWLQRLEGQALVVHRVESGRRLREVARCVALQTCTPLVAIGDGSSVVLRGNLGGVDGDGDIEGGERVRLVRLDSDGRMRTLHADPHREADLDRIVFDPLTRAPLIASYRSTIAANYGLDADTRRQLQRLEAVLPQRDLRISPAHGPGAHWLIEALAAHQQGARWHLYDPTTGRLRLLFDDAPVQARSEVPAERLPESALARKLPVRWRAGDGMRLHGFVSLPPGRDTRTLPLVVLVHGGPWNHARPDYNGIVQFLANRGYAVFEPNFRGSTGHGRAYMLAANGDFGNGRVQQDIVEGTHAMLAAGIGDSRRVGIVGASFGGYSSLLGLTFQPELFKVGVAFVPPPDFAWTLRWYLRNPESLAMNGVVPMNDMLRMLSLNFDDPAVGARLHAQSPLAHANRMNRPLLLIAGGEDRRVGIAGIVEYAARLKLANKDASLFIDADAGHTNTEPLARESNLYLLETMLHRHLGGTAPAPADAVLRGYLDANLRLCGRSLPIPCKTRRVADDETVRD